MRLIFSLILIFVSVHIFAGGIPKTMPDDFVIHYHSYLGQNPTYAQIKLSLGGCDAMIDAPEIDKMKIFTFSLSREELSTLYNALYALKAFTLKSKVSKNSNRGGEKIEYTIAGKQYLVNNYGSSFIIKSHTDHFIESIDLITAHANRHKH